MLSPKRPRRWLLSIFLLLMAGLFHQLSQWEIPWLDQPSQRYFDQSITSSSLAYAVIRGVNAIVSVLKESQVAVSPAGVGLTIAAGQILDPLDDMTERLSDVVVLAIVSLGIQKIGFELANIVAFEAVALLCLIQLLLIWLPRGQLQRKMLLLIVRAMVLFLLLRFLLPASSALNELVYQHFFENRIETTTAALRLISSDYDQLGAIENAGDISLLSGVSARIEKVQKLWTRVVRQAEGIISSLLSLTTLYLGVFLFQVLLIPLGGLWLLVLSVRHAGFHRWVVAMVG